MGGVNWAAAPTAADPVAAGYTGAEEGYKLGQQRAMVHALQGIDINDPASVQAGVSNLVKANAGEAANTISNLAFTRQMRSQVPQLMEQIQSAMKGGQTESSEPTDPAQIGHLIGTYKIAKDAADTLANTPEEDRQGAFEALKPDLIKRGIPQEALDSAAQHLSGDGPQDLSNYYGGLLAHAQGEGPMPDHHQSSRWSQNVLNNGPLVAGIAGLKAVGGPDYSTLLDTAKAVEAPFLGKTAEVGAAPALANVDVQKAIQTRAGTIAYDVAQAIGIKQGTLPYDILEKKIEAQIAAHWDVLPNVPEQGPAGPTGRTVMDTREHVVGGKPPVALSPAQQTGQAGDASNFNTKYTAEANQQAIAADKTASQNALNTARLAQTLNPSNILPWKSKVLNTLNGVGIKVVDKDANNLAAYQRGVSQAMKDATAQFPRLTGEFHAVQDASATAKTPGDAAALGLTMIGAARAQAAQEKEYRIQWAADNPGKYSETAFQQDWSHQPGANQSVFARPEFRDLKYNGKPAVAIGAPFTTGPHAGQTWGVFMPGTPQRTPFRVQ